MFDSIIGFMEDHVGMKMPKEEREKVEHLKELVPPLYKQYTKVMYPVSLYYFLLCIRANEFYSIVSSLNKEVLITRDPAIDVVQSDNTGILMIPKELYDKMDDATLEVLMVHEAEHLLKDNIAQQIKLIGKTYSKLPELLSAFSELDFSKIDSNLNGESKKLAREFMGGDLKRSMDKAMNSIDEMSKTLFGNNTEINIDMAVLSYYENKTAMKDKYLKLLTMPGYEKRTEDRVAFISAFEQCKDNTAALNHNFTAETFRKDVRKIKDKDCARQLEHALEKYFDKIDKDIRNYTPIDKAVKNLMIF